MAFCIMNLIMPSVCTHSRFLLHIIEYASHLVNQGLHHSQAKTDVFCSLIKSHAGLQTQWLNIVGTYIKWPSKVRIKEAQTSLQLALII